MAKERLDVRMVRDGLAPTRSRAQSLIREGNVLVDGIVAGKTGLEVFPESSIALRRPDHPFVSRGGLKLGHALNHWGINVAGKNCLDVGASTGGFTDALLQAGAARVTALDVGTGQLHPKIRADVRVQVWEKTNIKDFSLEQLGSKVDLVVVDVSFISLQQVFPELPKFLAPGSILVALLKPQFELGPKSLNDRGIVKEVENYHSLGLEMMRCLESLSFQAVAITDSPILGGDGNKEFLLYGEFSR